nr:PREDICTED: sperm flagellar protein 1-like isoform X6 [Equus przewalskii]
MLAEIVKHFYPRLVDLHNYIPTCNTDQKLSNWSVLSRQGGWAGRRQDCCAQASTGFLAPCLSWKVFHKLRLCISEVDIQKVVANTPGAIEPILCALREKVEDRTAHEDPPGSDVHISAILRPTKPLSAVWREDSLESDGQRCMQKSGPSWRALGTRRPQGAAAAGGEGAGSGSPAGVSQDMCVFLKILQMKVVRLEQLVKLKDQWIGVLLRPRDKPQ